MKNFEKLLRESEKNFEKLEKTDRVAEKQGLLVGRYIRENIADGYAYYQIIKENKTTVKIKHVVGISDDYIVSYWGKQATISKNYIKKSISFRDNLNEIFN